MEKPIVHDSDIDTNPIAVTSADHLRKLLKTYGINPARWEEPPRKNVERLFREVEDGESRIIHVGPTLGRLVSVVNVDIHASIAQRTYRLLESRQEFVRGGIVDIRRRGIYGVSEKVQGDESPEAAARRGIKEELSVNYSRELSPQGIEVIKKDSMSYPGLLGIYETHRFSAQFGLDEWNHDGYSEQQPDKTTFFTWEEQLRTD